MMILLLNSLFISFTFAIDCEKNPCHKQCIPPGFKCVPYGSVEYVKPYIPLVEGQRLVYFNSSEFPYQQIEEQMVPFFRDWAKSCPEEKRQGSSRGRENLVSVQRYTKLDTKSAGELDRTIAQVRPNTIIVQLSGTLLKFSKQYWNHFLDKLPKSRGCFILAPVTVSQNADTNLLLKSIEALIVEKRHSCQVVRVNEEVKSTVESVCEGPMARSAEQLDRCQMNNWIQHVQLKACDLDPRTFVSEQPGLSQPAGAAAGN